MACVQLHATLVNTKHRRRGQAPAGEAAASKEREALDASALLQQLDEDSECWHQVRRAFSAVRLA